jgi:hypothetical protein
VGRGFCIVLGRWDCKGGIILLCEPRVGGSGKFGGGACIPEDEFWVCSRRTCASRLASVRSCTLRTEGSEGETFGVRTLDELGSATLIRLAGLPLIDEELEGTGSSFGV